MKVEVFAILNDYFEKEFEIQVGATTIEALKKELLKIKPAAIEVLSTCRFAVNNEFIDNSFVLKETDTICIIPPSSGG
ncbi:MAG: MoaD/ThiS family protein [Ferruginibacter sp.]